MSKYNKFEDFMQSVINEADNKCKRRYGKSLADAYNVTAIIVKMVKAIVDAGWWAFLALAALLALGQFGFLAGLAAFVTTPAGILIVGAIAIFGGVKAIRELYKNRILPLAVKKTGEYYKSEFENHKDQISYIDSLIDRASDHLLSQATNLTL